MGAGGNAPICAGAPPLRVSVWRGGAAGQFVGYDVPRRANQTVLDVVTFIQQRLDPSLSYRFACRVGMCGSCAMTVNGMPRWTCRTHVSRVAGADGAIEIAPLRNLPVIKDLACDLAPFFDKWARAEGKFTPTLRRADDFERIAPASPARQAVDACIECIGCAVCYSACDVVTWNADYLGPAALNRAWTLVNDRRDGGHRARLAAVAGDAGCHACHSHQSCSERCPKQIRPTLSIAGLKRRAALAALKGEI
ncbi:MAG: succinate dehydrogenase/fumarate reductase iron-sulfur subunit [Alphaproteobacteria bacterium]|nr:succinate dehydrogenase/fumarate reductase iron-sulfur subunit [Alphaproteobacteria bacterium]